MVGRRLREARLARHFSLAEVAEKVHVSVATLSRVERDQQSIDMGLFLSLAKILKTPPQDLLEDDDQLSGLDPLVSKIAALVPAERIHLWRELADTRRQTNGMARRGAVRALGEQVEELLAQIDFLRGEIEAVTRRLRRSR
jgi:Predicted transcriptional regulators